GLDRIAAGECAPKGARHNRASLLLGKRQIEQRKPSDAARRKSQTRFFVLGQGKRSVSAFICHWTARHFHTQAKTARTPLLQCGKKRIAVDLREYFSRHKNASHRCLISQSSSAGEALMLARRIKASRQYRFLVWQLCL